MQKRFAGKTAVITGGASGIGLAIARRVIQEGGENVANDINAEGVAALAAELGEFGVAMVGDVTHEDDVASLFSTAINRFGSVDASFHVAGANKHAYIARMEEADWDFTINLCLKGVMFAMKHAAQAMLKQGHGAMVNIASLNAHVPMHAGAAYSTAKAGVEMLTKNGALELTPKDARPRGCCPSRPWSARVVSVPSRGESIPSRADERRCAAASHPSHHRNDHGTFYAYQTFIRFSCSLPDK